MKKLFLIASLIASVLFAQEDNVKNLAQGLNLPSTAEGHRVAAELEKGGAAAVEKLLELLQSANSTENTSATYALTALVANAPTNRDVIAQALADGLAEKIQDDNAKCTVLKLLRLCANDAQIPMIAAQLGNSIVRPYAIMTLTSIGSTAAEKALVEAATKADATVAFEYVSAFAKLKTPAATPVLLKLLDTVTPYQRVAVMNALAETGDATVADKLFDVFTKAKGTEQDGALAAIAKLVRRLDDKTAAARIARRLHEAAPSPTSLTALIDSQGLNASLPIISAAVASEDSILRNAALNLLDEYQENGADKSLLMIADKASPEVCADIIAFFGRRNHAAASSFVYKSLTSKEAVVRQAAIRAVTRYNSVMAMKSLAAALANGQEEDLPVIRETLSWFTSTNYAQALGEILGKPLPPARKIMTIELLAARRMAEQSAPIFAALEEKDSDVRKAAVKALEVLAKPEDINKLLGFLKNTEDAGELRSFQNALSNLGRTYPETVKSLVGALGDMTGKDRITLQQVLASIGGEEAMNAVLSDLQSPNQDIQDGAVRALSDWRDAAAIEPLNELAAKKQPELHHNLALKGLLRLYAAQKDQPVETVIANLKKVQGYCLTDEENTLVLGAAGDVKRDEVLSQIVMPAFENKALVNAASAAAVKIVCPPNPNDRGMTSAASRQAMEKVIALCDVQPLVLRAGSQLALFHIDGVNVAFNKPVSISCESEEGHPKELATDGIVNVDSAWWGKPWPCSITVDLQEAVSIDTFRPIFHWDNGRRFYAYTIETSMDNTNWQKVVDATENTLTSTNRGILHPLRQPVTARYARLSIVKNSANFAAHVVEFEIYSKSAKPPLATGPNLLLKQPVTFGSEQEQDHAPERAVDGLIGKWDGWHTDKCPTWLQVDMQRVAEIDTVRAIFYWDGSRTYSYNIEISEDGKDWKRVADVPDNKQLSNAQGFTHKFPATKARYVKINITKGWAGRYVHLVELEAYAAGKVPSVLPSAEPLVQKIPLPAPDADGFIT
ncbi:MAG: discoidin domain-containing protein, partial [Victivallales bacterium]|nr:discoidin domain-containing protein [Victivallales bacterium]